MATMKAITPARAELIEKIAIKVHQDANPSTAFSAMPERYCERLMRQVMITLDEADTARGGTASGLSVLQPWVQNLTLMQQAVLLTAIRGPDGVKKYDPPKMLLRWYRRCIVLGSFERAVLPTPYAPGGGSFTGPSFDSKPADGYWEGPMWHVFQEYCQAVDAVPAHYQGKLRQGAEILGYKHPDPRIRAWWHNVYITMVNDLHLLPESEAELDKRLGDNHRQWLERSNPATVK